MPAAERNGAGVVNDEMPQNRLSKRERWVLSGARCRAPPPMFSLSNQMSCRAWTAPSSANPGTRPHSLGGHCQPSSQWTAVSPSDQRYLVTVTRQYENLPYNYQYGIRAHIRRCDYSRKSKLKVFAVDRHVQFCRCTWKLHDRLLCIFQVLALWERTMRP